jgi:hypothetical protein
MAASFIWLTAFRICVVHKQLGAEAQRSKEILRDLWAPDVAALVLWPNHRKLRAIAMQRLRIEITEVFIRHAIELGEELDDLAPRITMIGRDVMTGTVAQGLPQNSYRVTPEHFTRCHELCGIAQLKRKMMHAR